MADNEPVRSTDPPGAGALKGLDPQWILNQLKAELRTQAPNIAEEFVPLPKLSQITRGPQGAVKAFFGVRCECAVSAVVTFEASNEKTELQFTEALPRAGKQLLAQRKMFKQMPCASHDRLRTNFA